MSGHPLSKLFAELRRRRVVRVAVAYLVAAFVVLQAADLLIEPLRLPEWTMTLLVVLMGIGFVLATALSWAFDLTPEGIRRTAAAPSAPRDPTSTIATTLGVVLVLALAAVGWLAFRPAGEAPVDAGAVVIMPARVDGADPALGYLRTGILDMLGAKLGGEVGPRAVDSRTTLHAVSGAGGAERDLPLEGARRVARGLGAGRLILAEVVGTADAFTVTARLLETVGGTELARVRAAGGEASLDSLADALTVQLLAGETGLADYRVPSLTSSFPAIRAYLRGRMLYRAGRHAEAAAAFHEALEQDSTFALAALGFMETSSWTTALSGFRSRAYRIAWENRHTLSVRDRDYLRVFLGPEYGEATETELTYGRGYTTAEEELATIRTALRSAPDRPELHYRLGDVLAHHGMAIGIEDALDRAERALSRAVELDPITGPLPHLVALKMRAGDTAEVRRLVNEYLERLGPSGDDADAVTELRWLMHQALGDPPPRDPSTLGTRPEDESIMYSLFHNVFVAGLDPRFVEVVVRHYHEGPAMASGGALVPAWTLALATGKPKEAAAFRDEVWSARIRNRLVLVNALIGAGPAEAGHTARDSLVPMLDAEGGNWDACVVALWDTFNGVQGAAERLAQWYGRELVELQSLDIPGSGGPCLAVQPAVAAAVEGRPEAADLLARADSVLRRAGYTHPAVLNIYNLVMARAHEEAGAPEPALAAARRAEKPFEWPYYLAVKLRTEGRLAALIGDRHGAIDAYRRYLALRPDPEPAERERDDRIRAELARLAGEGPR